MFMSAGEEKQLTKPHMIHDERSQSASARGASPLSHNPQPIQLQFGRACGFLLTCYRFLTVGCQTSNWVFLGAVLGFELRCFTTWAIPPAIQIALILGFLFCFVFYKCCWLWQNSPPLHPQGLGFHCLAGNYKEHLSFVESQSLG
jgi:hypothetical protein